MLRFRPHHFFCALGFQGKGYSDAFTANMSAIVDGRLRAENGDATEIEVVGTTDAICAPCPKRRDHLCAEQAKIDALDAAHAEVLHLRAGDVLTWGAAKARMAAQPAGIHARICAGCQWRPLGLCEAAHSALKSDLPE